MTVELGLLELVEIVDALSVKAEEEKKYHETYGGKHFEERYKRITELHNKMTDALKEDCRRYDEIIAEAKKSLV